MARSGLALLVAAVIGCGPVVEVGESDGPSSTSGEGGASETAPSPQPPDPQPPTPSTSTSGSGSNDDGDLSTSTTNYDPSRGPADGGGCGAYNISFICPGDVPPQIECSIWDQACPDGTKCAPWSEDGMTWDSTRCVPVDPDPSGLEEACTVEGSALSGIDSCGVGLMCWHVDPETLEGSCVPLCQGSEREPSCPQMCSTCHLASDALPDLCVAQCDPLDPICPEGLGCYLSSDYETFTCMPDVSQGAGPAGSPCQADNECQSGSTCLASASVPGCDASKCCTPLCPSGDDSRCAVLPGTQCVDLALPDSACPGESLGACVLP